jgi:hypothetical protein
MSLISNYTELKMDEEAFCHIQSVKLLLNPACNPQFDRCTITTRDVKSLSDFFFFWGGGYCVVSRKVRAFRKSYFLLTGTDIGGGTRQEISQP